MSSTEPPSRVPPRQQPQETKAAREELSSKGKVEKVREVDPDEQAKKKRFTEYYRGVDESEEEEEEGKRPSPFDLYAGKEEVFNGGSPKPSELGETEEAIVPSPSYTAPPDVYAGDDEEEDETTTSALPHSEDFWEEYTLPDQPKEPPQFHERSDQKSREIRKKEEELGLWKEKTENKKEGHTKWEKKKKDDALLFGPPGKASKEHRESKKQRTSENPPGMAAAPMSQRPTPMEETPKPKKRDKISMGPAPIAPAGAAPSHKQHHLDIELSSLPALPKNVQPLAMEATVQASSYLNPDTVSLFYQMVGTIVVMQNSEPGVNRTEVVLNNPAYANSKFYGATITIEKYATAPDSFNIRLTGSNEAVVLFRENLPSLITAFENRKLNFTIGRIDVEYSMDRPVFRRKERGEGKGDTGGGDLGERRK
ncbi:MAG: hypothetical protein KGR16_04555 [Verrucomicrobia bacterium]|nr:hypothetical protein [Verrucomicrobiota bacterium]